MTRENSRRAFLHSVGAVSLTGVTATSSAAETTLTAPDLVIPESAAPNDFDPLPSVESNRFTDALHAAAPGLTSSDIAVAGYWNGATQTDPEWVLSSMAVVADESLPRAPIEAAAEQAYDEYVAEYDAETSSLIDFEQTHVRTDQTTEWGVDMHRAPMFSDRTDGGELVFSERMRYQFFDTAAVATLAFGPHKQDPPVDALVNEYAALQRDRYETRGGTQ
ncbi:hypothetical protein [Haloarcula amylolytica]|uniref:Uncharacterized protein n=1 Tax=Haloarcula amylolytica JCM 13557 TaxID=1227452 RepID=M0KB40_9EURY|nr:hypothetical protein [Haloarcula amylolytica]EMA18436.1 hypothetical protein C442_14245 [Haloarcula amylolytica JCM 13557]